MSEREAMQAVRVGMELVKECKEAGYTLLGTGEMGIGNTTTSAAMAAALLSVPPEIVAGRGAGLSDEGLATKRRVIADALEKYQLRGTEPMRILCSVGGLDIAGLCGVFLGGAKYHMPIVADGVISAVAALTAERLCPGTKEFIIPSHKGKEPASELLMRELGLYPVIDAGLALGEGTGAVMMFSLLDIAMSLYETGLLLAILKLRSITGFDKVSVNIFLHVTERCSYQDDHIGDRGKRQRKICICRKPAVFLRRNQILYCNHADL